MHQTPYPSFSKKHEQSRSARLVINRVRAFTHCWRFILCCVEFQWHLSCGVLPPCLLIIFNRSYLSSINAPYSNLALTFSRHLALHDEPHHHHSPYPNEDFFDPKVISTKNGNDENNHFFHPFLTVYHLLLRKCSCIKHRTHSNTLRFAQ